MKITERVVVEYFAALWPLYTDQPLDQVETFPFAASCPWKGCINYTAAGWWVMVDASGGVRSTFNTLFHELAHIVAGDAYPGMKHARTVDQRRALARGETLPEPEERKQHATATTQGREAAYGPSMERMEANADGWGWQTAEFAWNVLEYRDSIGEAVDVVRLYRAS